MQVLLQRLKEEIHDDPRKDQRTRGHPLQAPQIENEEGDGKREYECEQRRPDPEVPRHGKPQRNGYGRSKTGACRNAESIGARQSVVGNGLDLQTGKAERASHKNTGQRHGQADGPQDGRIRRITVRPAKQGIDDFTGTDAGRPHAEIDDDEA